MEQVKVRVVEAFYDREADLLLRKKEEVYEVTEERAQKLVGLKLVELVAEETEHEPVEEKKPSKRGSKK